MAGAIPELKDLEAALAESADEASALNAWREYAKRGGLHNDSAAKAFRRRLDALKADEAIEHYGPEGWTPAKTASAPPGKGGGVAKALSVAMGAPGVGSPSPDSIPTPPQGGALDYQPMNNVQGEAVIEGLTAILAALVEIEDRLKKSHGILVAINRGAPKKIVGSPSAEEVE